MHGVFPAPSGEPSHALVAVSRDESTVAEVSWATGRFGQQSTLGVYDVASRERRVPDVRLPFPAGAVAVSPDGRYVAVSGYDDGRVLVYDTAGRERLPELATVDMTAQGVVALPPVGPAARLEAVRDFAEGRARQPTLYSDPRLEDPRLSPPGVGQHRRGPLQRGAVLPGRRVAGRRLGGRHRAGRRPRGRARAAPA